MLKPLDRKTMTMCKISNNKIRLINDKKKSNLQEEKVQEWTLLNQNNAIMLSEEDGQKKSNQNDKRGGIQS